MMNPYDEKTIRWIGFAASIPGGGHIRHGVPCQDASAVMTSPRPAAIVCDGRGSASLSHYGAQGAVDAFRFQLSVLEPFLINILDKEEEKTDQWIKFCRIMYRTLMQVKYDLAEKHNTDEKEFDCTVAFVIAGQKHIGCFQVGDGSIVLRQNGVCRTVFAPEKGEFANQTHFLRPGGEEEMRFQFALLDSDVNSGIAITSDGPEHLMFHLSDMTPGKIFDMFFDDLSKEDLGRQDLMDYLTRREWADDPRGSDDRSLALLARIGFEQSTAFVPETSAGETVSTAIESIPKTEPKSEEGNATDTEPNATMQEPVTETKIDGEVYSEVQTEIKEAKKKAVPCWTLALISGLTIGLLGETAFLANQHLMISQQQETIHDLHQQFSQKILQQNLMPSVESLHLSMRTVSPTEENEPQDSSELQPQTFVPFMETAEKEILQPHVLPVETVEENPESQPQTFVPFTEKESPETEQRISPSVTEKTENENTNEEHHHEM